MTFYPPRVHVRFGLPGHAGRVAGANGIGTAASFECGCFVRISLAIESGSKAVRRAGFQTNGCGYMVAVADLMAEMLCGKQLADLHSLGDAEFTESIEDALGKLPEARRQCARVVLEAVRAAFADHRAHVIEEFRGEKALICTCFGISEEAVEKFITAEQPGSVEEVTAACRAGAGCGSCRMLIQELIDEAHMNEGLR